MKKVIYIITITVWSLPVDSQTLDDYVSKALEKVEQQDYRGAIEYCTNALELDLYYVDAYILRADSKKRLDDFNGGLSKIGLGINDSGCLDLRKAGKLGP